MVLLSWAMRNGAITTILANSADDKLVIFFLFFPENRSSLHEMSNSVFWEKLEKDINISAAVNFTQSAKC